MKQHIEQLLGEALAALRDAGELPAGLEQPVPVERSRRRGHGDFASPLALALGKRLGRNPRALAERLRAHLPASDRVARVEIAGPGFLNFHLRDDALVRVVPEILAAGAAYGRGRLGAGRRVQVEFVSANPTGPLHVGHGRGAAYGDALANLLAAAGFEVEREYYVNDAGRQMHILALSVWLRYLERCGEPVAFPASGYQGGYVAAIAERLHQREGEALRVAAAELAAGLPPDQPAGGDRERHVDALAERARALLGEQRYRRVHTLVRDLQVDEIRDDLAAFGVHYQRWFSERSLYESGAIEALLERLRASGHCYQRDGALWFRSTAFGDEKDRVLVRENGEPTYFTPDLAYHVDKLERGFERVIDVWGADHHGYVARMKGGLAALGYPPERLDVLLVQFANLYRGGERVQMSTRSGEFVTLRELREEVGRDAARFFYVMRRCEQHLDFDLDLAKSQSSDNPVYYVQYAHARVMSVLREAAARGMAFDGPVEGEALARLTEEHEQALLRTLARFPELIEAAARALEPHQIAFYLRELAHQLHTYYNAHTFLVEEEALRRARLALVSATARVIANGLALLGVSAPERM